MTTTKQQAPAEWAALFDALDAIAAQHPDVRYCVEFTFTESRDRLTLRSTKPGGMIGTIPARMLPDAALSSAPAPAGDAAEVERLAAWIDRQLDNETILDLTSRSTDHDHLWEIAGLLRRLSPSPVSGRPPQQET